MQLKYLGTAAAEGIPAVFCDCDNCKKSMELGGKNLRTRSQAIIDNTLLIDFPPDTYWHYITHNIPMDKITNCLITHSHQDHLYAPEVFMRRRGFANFKEAKPTFNFYAGRSGCRALNAEINKNNISEVQANLVKPGDVFDVAGYTVTALKAAHSILTSPLVFIIEKDGKSVFYSNDTSEYPDASWKILKKYGKPISLISLDCTGAAAPSNNYVGHMNLARCIALRERLKSVGVADENTIFVLNHFSHNGDKVVYDDFVEIAADAGFLVSYDGMEIDL